MRTLWTWLARLAIVAVLLVAVGFGLLVVLVRRSVAAASITLGDDIFATALLFDDTREAAAKILVGVTLAKSFERYSE